MARKNGGYSLTPAVCIALVALLAAGCQTQQSSFEGPGYSHETRALEKQLQAEAAALGTMQGAAGIAASFDRSGVGSLVAMGAGRAARDALMIRAHRQMEAQIAKDDAAFLRQYGITENEGEAVETLPPRRRRPFPGR